MGSFFIYSSAHIGLEAKLIRVEVDISPGMPKFTVVGLPDTAINESKERVRAAIKNSGFSFPRTRVTVNLAPADIKKQGPAYDLPIAAAILAANGVIQNIDYLQDYLFIGELSLSGELRPADGILLTATLAQQKGFKGLILPQENVEQASLVKNLPLYPIKYLKELIENNIKTTIKVKKKPKCIKRKERYEVDMQEIKGQEQAKRAIEIACAGGHNILFSGPPGSGKTMLARAIPSIMPKMTFEEALEVTKIQSISHKKNRANQLITQRPFRTPHHTSSAVALIGGGTWPKPGEVSLAHRGVLFLDEFPEFKRSAIENLRQPLEDGIVTISRSAGTLSFPAQFMLVAAMNPCPCGFATDPRHPCTCSPHRVLKYQQKISGPILDRIDLCIEVPRVDAKQLTEDRFGENSTDIRDRIQECRNKQLQRYKIHDFKTNAELKTADIKTFCSLSKESKQFLLQAITKLHLSARAYTRLLKIARTIADLNNDAQISQNHLAEAIQYRPRSI